MGKKLDVKGDIFAQLREFDKRNEIVEAARKGQSSKYEIGVDMSEITFEEVPTDILEQIEANAKTRGLYPDILKDFVALQRKSAQLPLNGTGPFKGKEAKTVVAGMNAAAKAKQHPVKAFVSDEYAPGMLILARTDM